MEFGRHTDQMLNLKLIADAGKVVEVNLGSYLVKVARGIHLAIELGTLAVLAGRRRKNTPKLVLRYVRAIRGKELDSAEAGFHAVHHYRRSRRFHPGYGTVFKPLDFTS
jgi:hypothetical protein